MNHPSHQNQMLSVRKLSSMTPDMELVTITCPHCYGTGRYEDRYRSGRVDAAWPCVFCGGTGAVTCEVESVVENMTG